MLLAVFGLVNRDLHKVNEFYVFHGELLHSSNELPAENCQYINGN